MRRYLAVIVTLLRVVFTPLLVDRFDHPLVLLPGVIAIRSGVDIVVRSAQE